MHLNEALALRMLRVELSERIGARIRDERPRSPLLGVEVNAYATIDTSDERVLHGDCLRCYYRIIPWHLDQTLTVGGHHR